MGSLSLLQGNLSHPGIEPRSPALQAVSLPTEPQEKPNILNKLPLNRNTHKARFFVCLFVCFFPIICISWRLITLQYCSGFCHTLT